MTLLIVDGIKIDTANWIDANVDRFRDQNEPLGTRRKRLAKEIADYQTSLQNYGTTRPHDPSGEAHTKAYIDQLERLDKELAEEWKEKVKGSIKRD